MAHRPLRVEWKLCLPSPADVPPVIAAAIWGSPHARPCAGVLCNSHMAYGDPPLAFPFSKEENEAVGVG